MSFEADIYLAGEVVECSREEFESASQAEHNCCVYMLGVRWFIEESEDHPATEADNIVAVIAGNVEDAVAFLEDYATDDWDLLSVEETNI